VDGSFGVLTALVVCPGRMSVAHGVLGHRGSRALQAAKVYIATENSVTRQHYVDVGTVRPLALR